MPKDIIPDSGIRFICRDEQHALVVWLHKDANLEDVVQEFMIFLSGCGYPVSDYAAASDITEILNPSEKLNKKED